MDKKRINDLLWFVLHVIKHLNMSDMVISLYIYINLIWYIDGEIILKKQTKNWYFTTHLYAFTYHRIPVIATFTTFLFSVRTVEGGHVTPTFDLFLHRLIVLARH